MIPELADPMDGAVVPAAAVRILQDLAYRNDPEPDPDLPLPSSRELADVSTLSLPIELLVYLGILDISAKTNSPDLSELEAHIDALRRRDFDIFADNPRSNSSSVKKVISVPREVYGDSKRQSIEACSEIHRLARSRSPEASGTNDLTMVNIARIFEELAERVVRAGLDLRIVPIDSAMQHL